MVKRCVRIYIEGGAVGRTEDSDFRRGWKKFLAELHSFARTRGYHSLEVVRGKGRANTFEQFTKYHKEFPDDLCVLLVDAETVVPDGQHVWDTVRRRDGDQWFKPEWASERHLYLMVPFVEAWILTDPDALTKYFGRGFEKKGLPTVGHDKLSKDKLEQALKQATRHCSKGEYRHGQAHEIIEFTQPKRVKTLRDGLRLFEELPNLIEENVKT